MSQIVNYGSFTTASSEEGLTPLLDDIPESGYPCNCRDVGVLQSARHGCSIGSPVSVRGRSCGNGGGIGTTGGLRWMAAMSLVWSGGTGDGRLEEPGEQHAPLA